MFPASVKSTYKAIPVKGKKSKKGRKFLPSLFDDNMLSPRDDDMQGSDFKRPLFKNIKDNIDAGYDTAHTAERAEALKYGLTDEDKFNGYGSVQGNDRFQGSVFSQTQKLKRKKNAIKAKTLMTEERKHKYAKSVTHSAQRMDHTCFI